MVYWLPLTSRHYLLLFKPCLLLNDIIAHSYSDVTLLCHLTQHFLWRSQTKAEAGVVRVILGMPHSTSTLQRAYKIPEPCHFLSESLHFLLALLFGNGGGVHFEVENTGFDWIVVSLRHRDIDQTAISYRAEHFFMHHLILASRAPHIPHSQQWSSRFSSPRCCQLNNCQI